MTERKTARQIAIETGKCPMCDDCPDGCPLHAPDDSRNAMAAFDVTIDGEEWARLLAVESEYAAFRSGKMGIEEHYAALREIEKLKASVENWKYEAECEHDHVIEFMDINKQLRADIAELREREKWIPCSEMMPKPCYLVWVTDGVFVDHLCLCPSGEWERGRKLSSDNITHWMSREKPTAPGRKEPIE